MFARASTFFLGVTMQQNSFEFMKRNDPMYYTLKGKNPAPCTNVIEWGNWMKENQANKVIARTEINGKLVSTVFLGIDHNFSGDNPHIFETMVFHKGKLDEPWFARCSTWDEAEAQHLNGIKFAMEN